jgi:hypothetical protein
MSAVCQPFTFMADDVRHRLSYSAAAYRLIRWSATANCVICSWSGEWILLEFTCVHVSLPKLHTCFLRIKRTGSRHRLTYFSDMIKLMSWLGNTAQKDISSRITSHRRSRVSDPVRWMIFSIYLILPRLDHSVCNRNEYQKQKIIYLGSRARPVRRADKPCRYLWADCLDNVGSLTSHNPIGLHGLLCG